MIGRNFTRDERICHITVKIEKKSLVSFQILQLSNLRSKKKKKKSKGSKGSCNPIAILVCTTAPANNRVYGEKRGKERKKKKGASYARQKGKLYRRCNM